LKEKNMAAVTLYTHITEVITAGVAAGPVVEDNEVLLYSSTTADTLTLPVSTPTGFTNRIFNTGTQTVTLTAAASETVTGTVTIGAGDICTIAKTGTTTWKGALVGTNVGSA
jgi:hypothetical protein